MGRVYYCYPTDFEGGSAYGGDGSPIDDTFGSWDEDVTYKERTFSALSSPKEGRWYLTQFLPFATSINFVEPGIRGRRAGGGVGTLVQARTVLRRAGINYYSAFDDQGIGFANIVDHRVVDPSTGAAWQVSAVAGVRPGFTIGCSSQNADALDGRRHRLTGAWAAIGFEGLAANTEQVRDRGSREQWDWRKAKTFVELSVPLHVGLEVNVGDTFWLEHLAGIHPSDQGWREKAWQLRGCTVYQKTVQPAAGTVVLLLRDRRSFMCLARDTMWSPRSSSALGVGIARMGLGWERAYTRPGDAWILDPGSRLFVRKVEDEPLWTDGGEALVEAETNHVVESAFKNGATDVFTGWSKSGVGSNGSNITEDTSRNLWDFAATGVPRCVLFQAGTPIHGADLELAMSAPTASFPANTKLWSLAWLEALGAGTLYKWTRRGVDSKYWRESDQSWQAAKTWNPLPAITLSDDLLDHYASKRIDVGASPTTITEGYGIPTTGTPGSAFRLFATKLTDALDAVPFPILTESGTVTTPATRLRIENVADRRIVSETQGALTWEALSFFNSADIGSTYRTVFLLSNGNGVAPYIWGGYDGANARWFVTLSAGGTTVTSYVAAAVVRGELHRYVFRWTGVNAEQPTPGVTLPAYTATLLIDGVKGNDVSIPAAMRDTLLSWLETGSRDDAQRWSGLLRLWHSFPFVPSDIEASRLT
jgi:hypothetical protein